MKHHFRELKSSDVLIGAVAQSFCLFLNGGVWSVENEVGRIVIEDSFLVLSGIQREEVLAVEESQVLLVSNLNLTGERLLSSFVQLFHGVGNLSIDLFILGSDKLVHSHIICSILSFQSFLQISGNCRNIHFLDCGLILR